VPFRPGALRVELHAVIHPCTAENVCIGNIQHETAWQFLTDGRWRIVLCRVGGCLPLMANPPGVCDAENALGSFRSGFETD